MQNTMICIAQTMIPIFDQLFYKLRMMQPMIKTMSTNPTRKYLGRIAEHVDNHL